MGTLWCVALLVYIRGKRWGSIISDIGTGARNGGRQAHQRRCAHLDVRGAHVPAHVYTPMGALEEAPSIVTLHPATLDQYIQTVDALAAVLADHAGAEDDRGSLVGSFRALVHSVTIHPNGPREGFEVEVKVNLQPLSEGDCFPKQSVGRGNHILSKASLISGV